MTTVSGFDPSIFSLILPSEEDWRDTLPLPRARRMRSAVAAGQSRFLQHSAAIVWPGPGAAQGASHPRQAGTVGTSVAQQHR